LHSLETSKLVDVSTLTEIRAEAYEDVDALIETLKQRGLLTAYQVRCLASADYSRLLFGPYRILEELGEGGFGQVFLAKHEMMERLVALKIILPERADDLQARDIFLREVVAMTQVVHPNIAAAYDAGEIDGTLFFALEYVPGTSLDRHVGEQGKLSAAATCRIGVQVAHALQCAHEHGLVHRDLNPKNIVLAVDSPGGTDESNGSGTGSLLAKVIDFGLARLVPRNGGPNRTICATGPILGTLGFIAPEQLRDYHEADIRSDLFGLGCTLYFALSGQLPFVGGGMNDVVYKTMEEDPVPLHDLCPELPAELVSTIERLMAKDPTQRYQTPNEAADALYSALWSAPPAPPTEPSKLAVAENQGQRVPTAVRSPFSQQVTIVPEEKGTGASFHDAWSQWLLVLEECAAMKPPSITANEYRWLHWTLLKVVLDGDEPLEGVSAEARAHLIELIEPWPSLGNLRRLDRKILTDLCNSCQQANRSLKLPRSSGMRGVIWAAVVFVLACSAGTYLLAGFGLLKHWIGGTVLAYRPELLDLGGLAFSLLLVLMSSFWLRRSGTQSGAKAVAGRPRFG
jgi:serine/threonine-protein kinase